MAERTAPPHRPQRQLSPGPRISDLVRGKVELFSIDGLANMLAHAGLRVDLTVQEEHGRAA